MRIDVRKEDIELLPSDETSSSFDYRMYETGSQEETLPYAPVSPAYVPGSDSSNFIPVMTPTPDETQITDKLQPVDQVKTEDQSDTKDEVKRTDILEVPEEESKEELKNQEKSQSVSGEKKVIEVEDNSTSSSEIKRINI